MITEETIPSRHEEVILQLKELGLSEHEAEVYTTVLGLGEVPAGKVLDLLPLHREQVYRALKRLVATGLLVTYTKRKRSYYSATGPEVLVRKQEARTALARTLQPYLNKLQQNRPQIIQTIEGPDALERMLEDIIATLPHHSEYLVMGGVGELFYEKTKEALPRFGRVFKKKDIAVRIVAFQGQNYSAEQKVIGSRVRYLDQPVGGPTATVVYGSKVAIEIFDPNNLAVIVIENEYLANSYRQVFEGVWKVAREKVHSTDQQLPELKGDTFAGTSVPYIDEINRKASAARLINESFQLYSGGIAFQAYLTNTPLEGYFFHSNYLIDLDRIFFAFENYLEAKVLLKGDPIHHQLNDSLIFGYDPQKKVNRLYGIKNDTLRLDELLDSAKEFLPENVRSILKKYRNLRNTLHFLLADKDNFSSDDLIPCHEFFKNTVRLELDELASELNQSNLRV